MSHNYHDSSVADYGSRKSWFFFSESVYRLFITKEKQRSNFGYVFNIEESQLRSSQLQKSFAPTKEIFSLTSSRLNILPEAALLILIRTASTSLTWEKLCSLQFLAFHIKHKKAFQESLIHRWGKGELSQ